MLLSPIDISSLKTLVELFNKYFIHGGRSSEIEVEEEPEETENEHEPNDHRVRRESQCETQADRTYMCDLQAV